MADIRINRPEVIVQNNMTYIVGAVANECPDATGAQIHVALRDDKGGVVLSDVFWPAGAHNIPSHGSTGFTYVVSPGESDPGRRASSIEVDILALRKW